MDVNKKARLDELEKKLDLVNIVIMRRKIELEFERLEDQQEKKSGWFSWMWSSSKQEEGEKSVEEATNICKKPLNIL